MRNRLLLLGALPIVVTLLLWNLTAGQFVAAAGARAPAILTGALITLVAPALVAEWRRPRNRVSWLAVIAGSALAVSYWRLLAPSWSATLGAAVWFATPLLLIHLLLGYPDGLPRAWRAPAVVGCWLLPCLFAIGLVLSSPSGTTTTDSGAAGLRALSWVGQAPYKTGYALFPARQGNPLWLWHSPSLQRALTVGWSMWVVGVSVAGAAVLVRRWRWAAGPGRRLSALVAAAGVALALAALAQPVLAHPGSLDSIYIYGQQTVYCSPYSVCAGMVFGFGRWYGAAALITPALAGAVVGGVLIWAEIVQPRLSLAISGALRLAPDTSPEALRQRLARTLGDASARLLFRLDDASWVDAAGKPATLASGQGRATTVLTRDGRPVAAIECDGSLLAQRDLVDVAVTSVAASLDGQRLAALEAASADDIRASAARLLKAADETRVAVERRIAEGPDKTLERVSALLDRDLVPMAQVHAGLRHAVAQLRSIAHGLHPISLTEHGLAAALDDLAADAGLGLVADQLPAMRLPAAIEVTLYLVISNALARSFAPVAAHFNIDGAATVTLDGWAGPLDQLVSDRVDTLGGIVTSRDHALSVSVPLLDS